MEVSWPAIKEAFFAVGSVAGVLALLRPVLESKHQRDSERAKRILTLLPEQQVVDLEMRLYQARMVPTLIFDPFDQLAHEVRSNQEGIRFSGLVAKTLRSELLSLLSAYESLRKLVQVPQWEPRSTQDEEGTSYYWDFNKDAFRDRQGVPQGYASHLDECVDRARDIKRAYQRFQIVSELHLLESPIASQLLKRRFRANGVA